MKKNQVELDARLNAEAKRVKALQSRGLLARLMNNRLQDKEQGPRA